MKTVTSRPMAFALGVVLLAVALCLGASDDASAQRSSGIQGGREVPGVVLLSKDVGNERWSIYYDEFVATGVVYPQDGGVTRFVWCEVVDEDDPLLFDCWGAESCDASGCTAEEWTPIGEELPIPASFFELPGGSAAALSRGSGPKRR